MCALGEEGLFRGQDERKQRMDVGGSRSEPFDTCRAGLDRRGHLSVWLFV